MIKKVLITIILAGVFAEQADAYRVQRNRGRWIVRCNEYGWKCFNTKAEAEAAAEEFCADKGGVANIDPVGLQSAIDLPAGLTSGLTFGMDLGGGNYQVMTEEEFNNTLDPQTGEGTLPQGFHLLSFKVNGIELLPNPVPVVPLTLTIEEIYEIDEITGNQVGGRLRAFEFTSLLFSQAGDQVTLTWTSEAEETYPVEKSTDLENWQQIGLIAAQGLVTSFVDLNATGGKHFYRVLRDEIN